MKIAMMTNNYKPFIGGVPISVDRLAKGLRVLGHEVVIFAPEYETETREEDEKDHVIRYRSVKGKVENGAVIPNIFDARIRKAFAKESFDLIHVHHPALIGNAAVHYSKKYNIPLVFTYHTKYEEYLHYVETISGFRSKIVTKFVCEKGKKALPWYMKKYLKQCSAVVAPSHDIHHYVRGLNQDIPVQVIPTGLPDDAYEGEGEVCGFHRKELLGEKQYLLVTVSRLEKEKNQYFLIDAVNELKEKMGDCFRFVFVGDGSERKNLEAYVKNQDLEDTVFFAGSVPNREVKYYLAASDAFLFASKSETQGIVLLEAMAAGLPVAALCGTGVRDIVKDGKNGCLIDGNLSEYVEKVAAMLKNTEERQRYVEGAKETALCYHSSSVAKIAEEFYENAIENRKREELWGRKEVIFS